MHLGAGNDVFRDSDQTSAFGNDTVFGDGNDTFYGSGGQDRFTGGKGADVFVAGAGKEVFILADCDGPDVIFDFKAGADRIDLSGVTEITDFRDLIDNHMQQDSFGTAIDALGVSVFLHGTDLVDLSLSDFIF